MTYRKKLIEVALPLDAINAESAREKSIRHGHPSTLHLWWARRPLAACRAVLFAQLVDDPSEYMPDEKSADEERERLFDLIEELVKWENINNEDVLDRARLEIARSVARDLGEPAPVGKQAIREFLATKAPPVLDPFAGGGSIPLEAQRLGLRAYASDLNPVAVLINKALIEIPPKFANMPPVHPALTPDPSPKSGRGEKQAELWTREWKGAEGLAEDVRYYGKWMRGEAIKRLGHLYPPITITEEIIKDRPDLVAQGIKAGDKLTVIAWLWARTVKCPNPACNAEMPLIKSYWLSKRKGSKAWIAPLPCLENKRLRYKVVISEQDEPSDGTVNRNGAACLCCNTPVSLDYIRAEGINHNLNAHLIAIVAEGRRGRIFIPPQNDHEIVSKIATPTDKPDTDLPNQALGFRVQLYGFTKHSDLFSPRQLTALITYTDLVRDTREKVLKDAINSGLPLDERPLYQGGCGSIGYADAVTIYSALSISKAADLASTICHWQPNAEQIKIAPTFALHALPMTWDFAEGNPLSDLSGNFYRQIELITKVLEALPADREGNVTQNDATKEIPDIHPIISTDPPYYDNIGYSDLSDYFYVWLRRALYDVYPPLFRTVLTPKVGELIANPFRHGSASAANVFFENGMLAAFTNFHANEHPNYPITVFYAFKQSESEEGIASFSDETRTVVSTGWETMLEALQKARFSVVGTWPIRTERRGRTREAGSNALASSIVLVCRPRIENASAITRRDFLAALKRELPPALHQLQQGSIAPVDLVQDCIS
jgi:putative DNA methylase